MNVIKDMTDPYVNILKDLKVIPLSLLVNLIIIHHLQRYEKINNLVIEVISS